MASTTITLVDEFLPEDHPLYGQELEFVVQANVSPYDPGKTWGRPEDCYPPEGGEVEVIGFEPKMDSKGVYPVDPEWADRELMKLVELNGDFRKYVEEQMFEAYRDSRDDDDSRYDRWKDEGR